jgi:hypothetical protein
MRQMNGKELRKRIRWKIAQKNVQYCTVFCACQNDESVKSRIRQVFSVRCLVYRLRYMHHTKFVSLSNTIHSILRYSFLSDPIEK